MTTAAPGANPSILVVDDEPDLRTLYELTLLREGYRVDVAETVTGAWQQLLEHRYEVLITDMRLPDGLGIELIQRLRALQRSERCVVITAYGSAENAVESLKAGAFDYLSKPVDLKQFRTVIASAVQDALMARQAVPSAMAPARQAAAPTSAADASLQRLVGTSPAIRQVRDRIVKVARSMAPVLICGESGTGKELTAQALHASSHRGSGPLVAVNCSAIPENLLETEFFGVKKGAYTGANADREGYFQAARGGTLFLDEIGDLPLSMQSKLLRAIQERAHHQCHPPQPGTRGPGRALPAGSLLPAQRDRDRHPPAARTPRRPACPVRGAASTHRTGIGPAGAAPHASHAGAVGPAPPARQCARARKPAAPRRGPERRR
jgi:two-component system response regulator PilR (NtrC family)